MKAITTYLNFDGQTHEAMKFYADALGAELSVQSNKDVGMEGPPGTEDRITHARLWKGPIIIMASDTQPGAPFVQGNNFYICIECEDHQEIEDLFRKLGQGGKTQMELQDTFWGARFGMLLDKFNVGWMFNLELPKK